MRTIRAGQIQSLFAGNIRKLLEECVIDYEKLYEIRLRTGRPVFLCYGDGEKFLRTGNGMPYRVTRQDLKETLEYISGYSLYAYEDEIRQGYLSVQGGHRVGITGKVILDGVHIRGMKYISCINVRLAHQVQGCADEVLPYIRKWRAGHSFSKRRFSGNESNQLTEKMQKASEEMRFEDAAEARDLIRSIQKIGERQKITAYGEEDRDIIACDMDESLDLREQDAVVQVFFMRDGKLIGRDHFYLRVARGDTRSQVLSSFVKQFYAGTPFIPGEITLQTEIEDADVIEEWLTSRRKQKVRIVVPKKGTKEKLVELAWENARMVLEKDRERIRREEGRTIGAVHEVEDWLGLKDLNRMEAFDISNISGFESVGSMVVYEKGKPKRSDYRKFRIKSVQGPNDYASMEEVLTRRFTHESNGEFDSFSRMPDLLLMDGGRGQVNIALGVLDKLGIRIPVCGMVKDDHHRTRGLYFVILKYQSTPTVKDFA